MATHIITSFFSNSRELLDRRAGPYPDLATAYSTLDEFTRSIGMEVVIIPDGVLDPGGNYIGGTPTVYKFVGGIDDVHLVKTDLADYLPLTGGTVTGPVDFEGSTLFKGNIRLNNNGDFPQLIFRTSVDDKLLTRVGDVLTWNGEQIVTVAGATLTGPLVGPSATFTTSAVFGSTGNASGMTVNVIPSGPSQYGRIAFAAVGSESTKSFVGVNTLNSNNLILGIANTAWLELLESSDKIKLYKELEGTAATFTSGVNSISIGGKLANLGGYQIINGGGSDNTKMYIGNTSLETLTLQALDKIEFQGVSVFQNSITGTSAEFSGDVVIGETGAGRQIYFKRPTDGLTAIRFGFESNLNNNNFRFYNSSGAGRFSWWVNKASVTQELMSISDQGLIVSDTITAGNGTVSPLDLRSTSGSRGMTLRDSGNTSVARFDWNGTDILIKRASDDTNILQLNYATKKATFFGDIESQSLEVKNELRVDGKYRIWDDDSAFVDAISLFPAPLPVIGFGNPTSLFEAISATRPLWFDGNDLEYFQTTSGGPTANRPSSPQDFEQYFDTDLGSVVTWNGSTWVSGGGGSSLHPNAQTFYATTGTGYVHTGSFKIYNADVTLATAIGVSMKTLADNNLNGVLDAAATSGGTITFQSTVDPLAFVTYQITGLSGIGPNQTPYAALNVVYMNGPGGFSDLDQCITSVSVAAP